MSTPDGLNYQSCISLSGESHEDVDALFFDADGDGDLDALRAAVESDPDDLESRLQLANQLVLANEFPEALDQLLEIIRKDRSFNDEAPRQTMIKIFELLGNQGEIVSSYRRQLGRLLY